MPLPTDPEALSAEVQVATVEAVRRMAIAWPEFAGNGEPGEIEGSMWYRIATYDHARVDRNAPIALDIIHRGDVRGDGTLIAPASGAGEALGGVLLVLKAYLWDAALAPDPPPGADPNLAKNQLVWLRNQLCSMLERGSNVFPFGHEHGSPYYGVSFVPPPQPTNRYHQDGPKRWCELVCVLDVVAPY